MARSNAAVRDRPKAEAGAAMHRVEVRPRPLSSPTATQPGPVAVDMPDDREPFGAWLLAQRDRGDWIDELVTAARRDPGFPKRGTPDKVRDHLQARGADADAFEQVADAERCWLGL